MKDIFDNKILCKYCNAEMKSVDIEKSGFKLRAIKCPKCDDKIIHPTDLEKLKHYNSLKQKTYNVKLRMVGNSHAISIPKEILNFINEMNSSLHKQMNEMVKLCFEDFGKISLNFFDNQINKKEIGRLSWQKQKLSG